MKVCFWRVALGQQIKPKLKPRNKTVENSKFQKKAKKVLITFQL